MIGSNNPFFGKHHTKKTKAIISKANSGRKLSKQTRENLSLKLKGRIPWNKNKKMGKVKHHIYGKEFEDILILTNSEHGKLHQWAYLYILQKYGKKAIDTYIKWFKKEIKNNAKLS